MVVRSRHRVAHYPVGGIYRWREAETTTLFQIAQGWQDRAGSVAMICGGRYVLPAIHAKRPHSLEKSVVNSTDRTVHPMVASGRVLTEVSQPEIVHTPDQESGLRQPTWPIGATDCYRAAFHRSSLVGRRRRHARSMLKCLAVTWPGVTGSLCASLLNARHRTGGRDRLGKDGRASGTLADRRQTAKSGRIRTIVASL